MKEFIIQSNTSRCRKLGGGFANCLSQDVRAFYNSDYIGGRGRYKIKGTVENLICTFKNDVTRYDSQTLHDAGIILARILKIDFPEILKISGKLTLRVCVIPRAKEEGSYRPDQLRFRDTVRHVVSKIHGLEDGTHDIIRHTHTTTTHLSRRGDGGTGEKPYIGITKDTCNISNEVIDKNILLIDDLYTKTVNIGEDCIQALLDKGAKSVIFYSVGKTL